MNIFVTEDEKLAQIGAEIASRINIARNRLPDGFNDIGLILLAFDRDGTLVPYADHPDDAQFEPNVLNILEELACRDFLNVAIVSARGIADLQADFKDRRGVILAGNYGLQICHDGANVSIDESVSQLQFEIQRLIPRLASLIAGIDNIILEDHQLSVCLHWHNVPAMDRNLLHGRISNLAQILKNEFSLLDLRVYPTSYEIFPRLDWTKADGLQSIFQQLNLVSQCEKVIPEELTVEQKISSTEIADSNCKDFLLFAGDTDSDEAGFQWVNERNGLSIRVSPVEVPTAAKYTVESPMKVVKLLSIIEKLC